MRILHPADPTPIIKISKQVILRDYTSFPARFSQVPLHFIGYNLTCENYFIFVYHT